ncbi:DUF4843 domain-containing protein [Sphingobacterium sp.]|uniref:DUF4843 domain-containing protein n=1 Tax=Sphingobacterium sp. TaxID=341027 RepID=UPI0031CF5A38
MKKFSIYILVFPSYMLLFSCKKSDLITYEGSRALYFSVASTDSISIDFSKLSDDVTDTIFKIPVGLLGRPLEIKETFEVAVNDSITTAIKDSEFELPEQFSFPSKKSSDTVAVKFIRTARMTQREFVLALELKSNAQFDNTLYDINKAKNRSRKIRIFVTDILKPTPKWLNTPDVLGTEHYLGRFTKKKIQVLVSVYDNWSFNEIYDNIDTYASYFGDLLNHYLKAQKATGTPVLEDDGTLMEVGPFYK